MAKIRHVAIKAENSEALANFYKMTFGMTEVARGQPKEGGRAVYLSDGYINLAILPARGGAQGIQHFGFQVDDVEETEQVALTNGAAHGLKEKPRDGRFAEFSISDPVGTSIDLSKAGWRT